MLDALVAAAIAVAPPAPSDLPAWCVTAISVDRSTAPDGAQWALCQAEDPFGEDRLYVRRTVRSRWVLRRPEIGFRGGAPLLAIDHRTCLAGGLALTLFTDRGADQRTLVDFDGTSFSELRALGHGRYAARRNDGMEWRGRARGRWRAYPLPAAPVEPIPSLRASRPNAFRATPD